MRLRNLVALIALSATACFAQQGQPKVTVLQPDPVNVTRGKSAPVKLEFRIPQGYHINSHTPHSDLLIATELKMSPPTEIATLATKYPDGEEIAFPFMPNEKLSVYSGDFEIVTNVRALESSQPGTYRVRGELRYQACSDRQCFPPKTTPVEFDVKVAKAAAGASGRQKRRHR